MGMEGKAPNDEADTESPELIDQLPLAVQMRIEKLEALHEEREKTMKEYFEERAKLEAKYQALAKPLYQKRADIISGKLDTEIAKEMEGEESGAADDEDAARGIPQFWTLALAHADALADLMTENDLTCLESLQDIQCVDDENGEGFTLTFHFSENEFFENSVLTKRYEVPNLLLGDEPILKNVSGCEIKWNEGKDLTYVEKTQKQKGKGKNSGQVRIVKKKEKAESFFHFFTPPTMPSMDKMTEEDALRLESEFDTDYSIAQVLRSKLIPDAIMWYHGAGNEQQMEAAMEGFQWPEER